MKAFYCLIIYLSIHLCGYAILPTQFHFRHYNIKMEFQRTIFQLYSKTKRDLSGLVRTMG